MEIHQCSRILLWLPGLFGGHEPLTPPRTALKPTEFKYWVTILAVCAGAPSYFVVLILTFMNME